MSDYIPTTDEIRKEYGTDYKYADEKWEAERIAEFDRWLAAHDAEVRADILVYMDKWIGEAVAAAREEEEDPTPYSTNFQTIADYERVNGPVEDRIPTSRSHTEECIDRRPQ